jgi:hypothetical protein
VFFNKTESASLRQGGGYVQLSSRNVFCSARARSQKIAKAKAASKGLAPWQDRETFDYNAAAGQSYELETANVAAEYAREKELQGLQ